MPRITRGRRRRTRLLALLLLISTLIAAWHVVNRAISPWTAVHIHAPLTTGVPGSPPDPIRIATFNIAHGRGQASSNWDGGHDVERLERLTAIADTIASFDADIVVLNEVDFDSAWSSGVNQARFIAERAGYPWRAEQRNSDVVLPFFTLRFGNAVLSRFPILDAERIAYPALSTIESIFVGRKLGLCCRIATSDESALGIVAVHLESRDEATRVASARLIAELEARETIPLIAAGDFNSAPLGYPFAQTDVDGHTAISSLLATGRFVGVAADVPDPEDFTFPADNPDRVIDWILAPAEWPIVTYTVHRSDLSDHLPVVAELAPRSHAAGRNP